MKVLVTGATGFVGGHTAALLTRSGHDVVALVRDPHKLHSSMRALDAEVASVVVGDMTDRSAVDAALDQVEAVVHCAAVVSLARRDEARMLADNLAGFDAVVGGAVRRELDPLVHVSSTSALFRPGVGPLRSDTEVSDAARGYGRSKAECERLARRLQEQGAPIAIVYPSGILGPAAGTTVGETGTEVARFLAAGVMPTRRASLSFVDVRDLAAVIASLLEPGHGPRRVMCGGHMVTMEDLAELLRGSTGRRFPIPPVPPSALRGAGRAVDVARQVVPFESPLSREGMELVTYWQGTDDRELVEMGIGLREPIETMTTSVSEWHRLGMVSDRQAGTAGTGGAPAPRRSLKDRITGVKIPGWVLASTPFRWAAPKVLPRAHRLLHHLSGGRWMFDSKAQPMCMLTTTGARSGQPRETPLAAVPVEDDKLLVVGSNFASDKHPAWTGNLLAHPDATVTFRGRTFPVRSRLLSGEERSARWDELLTWFPNWSDYTEVTDREFRVFELQPAE